MVAIGLLAAWRVTNDFDFRLYHPFPSFRDSKSALLCCVASSFPLLVCALPRFPPAAPLSAHNRFFLPWAAYYRPLAFPPNLYCLLLEIFCLLGICCLCLFVLCANRIGASDDEASVATTTPFVGVTALPRCHSKTNDPRVSGMQLLSRDGASLQPFTCPGSGKGAQKVEMS